MDDTSGLRAARKAFSIALSAFTGLMALLWAWPKFGEGGFVWTLSLPVGVGFVYLVHLLTAPPQARRSVWVPIGIASVLTVLWFVGLFIIPLATPDGPGGMIMVLFMMMLLWPLVMAGGLVINLVLKLAQRGSDRGAKNAETAGLAAGVPAMPAAENSPSFVSGSSPPTAPVPAYVPYEPARSPQPRSPLAPSALPRPSSASGAELSAASPALDSDPAGSHRVASTDTRDVPPPSATDVPLQELSTLAEVAVSLGEDDASSALTMVFSGGEIAVSADGTPLGSVETSWTGSQTGSATVLAAEVLEGLRSFGDSTSHLTITPGTGSVSELEVRAADSDHSFTIRSFTA